MQDSAIEKLQSQVMEIAEGLNMVAEEVASAPTTVATVTFASGQTALSAKSKETLDAVVSQLMEASDAKIHVVGHADGTPVLRGGHKSNWGLSQARADSAAKYLASKGIDSGRLHTLGKAHTEPVASQNTAAGRAMNRRVEIILVPAHSH